MNASSDVVIDVRGLTKKFDGRTVVRDLSMQVKRGVIYGFLGPNGSGKTTTIRMLCGLLTPDGGTGTCLGYDIRTETEKIKRHVGYMTQRFSLYQDLSIHENLEFVARVYGLAAPETEAREAYRLLGLQSYFTAGPKEIRAWTIPIGATAPQAAGVIHTDFERGFIRAEIYTLDDLKQHKTEAAIKAAGKMRAEGKAYVMKDGDITHFLFNV